MKVVREEVTIVPVRVPSEWGFQGTLERQRKHVSKWISD